MKKQVKKVETFKNKKKKKLGSKGGEREKMENIMKIEIESTLKKWERKP